MIITNKPIAANNGYLKVKANRHYLAGKSGYVPYHRMVLYNRIGGSNAACHWCGYIIDWKTDKQPQGKFVINADHLDGDKTNNSTHNIVPSCSWCNYNRSWIIITEFFSLTGRYGKTAPWDRPNIVPYQRRIGTGRNMAGEVTA